MNNNDILRRLRYVFDYNDVAMMKLFQLGGQLVSRKQISGWLKKDEDPEQLSLPDVYLAGALNGLIIQKRGKREGDDPIAETRLNNNIILRKLKIALDLRDDDMLALLSSVDLNISKHELSALFRKQGHKHYRECKDQILRNLLTGLQKKHRPDKTNSQNRPEKPKHKPKSASTSSDDKPFEWKVPERHKGKP